MCLESNFETLMIAVDIKSNFVIDGLKDIRKEIYEMK